MIQFINVSKEYRNGTVGLRDINVKIEDGEFAFLVGASGAGKSTFTKLMIREITPTSGSILIDGKGIHRLRKREIPIFRRNMGFVFQNYRLLSDRTAFENVAFAMEALGYGKDEVEKRAMRALEQMGLANRASHFPAELSGGEQQRIAIARAIVNNPKILVADEPTGNLDYDTSREIMNILYDINRQGTTILMATHDRSIVENSHHRILTLSAGRLVGDDNLQAGYAIGQTDIKRTLDNYSLQRENKREFHLASTEHSRINSQLSNDYASRMTVTAPQEAKTTKSTAVKEPPKAAKSRLLTETAVAKPNPLLQNTVSPKKEKEPVLGNIVKEKTNPEETRHQQIQRLLDKSNHLKEQINEPLEKKEQKMPQEQTSLGEAAQAPNITPDTPSREESAVKENQLDDLEKLILEAFK